MFAKKITIILTLLISLHSLATDVNVAVLIKDYYPWVYFNEDTNQHEGFDIEVVEMIVDKLGYNINFKYLPPADLKQDNIREDFDLFVGRIYNTENLKRIMYLTDNYTASDFVLWGHENFYKKFNVMKLSLKSLPSIMAFISNKTFAMGVDKKEYSLVKYYLKDLSDVDFFSSQEQIFEAMEQDDLMAISDWHYVLNLMQSSKAEYLPFGRTIMREDIDQFVGTGEAIGVSFDNPELYQSVNNLLKEMKKNGSLREVSLKYFGKDITLP